jgi:hypothetical protein
LKFKNKDLIPAAVATISIWEKLMWLFTTLISQQELAKEILNDKFEDVGEAYEELLN